MFVVLAGKRAVGFAQRGEHAQFGGFRGLRQPFGGRQRGERLQLCRDDLKQFSRVGLAFHKHALRRGWLFAIAGPSILPGPANRTYAWGLSLKSFFCPRTKSKRNFEQSCAVREPSPARNMFFPCQGKKSLFLETAPWAVLRSMKNRPQSIRACIPVLVIPKEKRQLQTQSGLRKLVCENQAYTKEKRLFPGNRHGLRFFSKYRITNEKNRMKWRAADETKACLIHKELAL